MIKKWVIMNFSIYLPCSPPVGQYQCSQNLYFVVTGYEFYDDLGTHFPWFLTKKTCTEVVAVLTIRNVWVICSLVFLPLHRSFTRKTHWKISYNALPRKVTQAKYGEKALFMEKISLNIVYFMPSTSNQKLLGNISIFYAKCSYTFHSANKEKISSLTLI